MDGLALYHALNKMLPKGTPKAIVDYTLVEVGKAASLYLKRKETTILYTHDRRFIDNVLLIDCAKDPGWRIGITFDDEMKLSSLHMTGPCR